jgi:hypothetical protein
MINSKDGKKDVSGLTLMMQSGGINDSARKKGDMDYHGAKRSKHFLNDFYIDNIQIESLISGTATGSPSNSYELNFTVTEPMGLTFLENLHNAVQEYNEKLKISDKEVNFVAQTYLMVIRFYGYDEEGNIKSGDDIETSDPKASVEKFIPFMFKNISFQMNAAQVEYRCEAVCLQSHIASDRVHGTIQKTTQVQGETLDDILNNGDKCLKTSLNEFQKKLAKEKYGHPDTYDFEFKSDNIKTAKMKQAGSISLGASGHGKTDKVDADSRINSIHAGTSIIKYLDLAIRSSSFILDQFEEVRDNKAGKLRKQRKRNVPLNWFKISPRITVGPYDKKRNDYSYHITYVISEYEVQTLGTQSALYTGVDCFNVHKEYNFWFTGQNTEVLNFTQDYNAMYLTSFSGAHTPTEGQTQTNFNNVWLRRLHGGTKRNVTWWH